MAFIKACALQFYHSLCEPGNLSVHFRQPHSCVEPPRPANHERAAALQEGASHAVLKKAFFKRSKEWHPDKVEEERKEEATQMFQKINAAYQVGVAGGPPALS